MANIKGIMAFAFASIILFFCWFYFAATLKLTDITGKPSNPVAGFFVNLIDFDTGLTRYDLHNLSNKSDYWQKRIQEVSSIQNTEKRNIENQRLIAEMMEDPIVKKLAVKFSQFGVDAIISILQASK